MPWIENNKTVTATDYGPPAMTWTENGETHTSEDHTEKWRTVTVQASTSGSTLSYTITSTRSNGTYFSLYIKIGDTEIVPATYFNSSNTNFPFGKDTTKTGTINIGSKTSIPIVVWICNAQDAATVNATEQAKRWVKVEQTLTRVYYEDCSIGSLSIVDNGNNTFTVNADRPTVGTNNSIKTATLTCNNSYISSNISASCKDAAVAEQRAILSTYSRDTLSVTATVTADATYGTDPTKSVTATIPFYRAPSAPANVRLDDSSFKNGRLTIKRDWKFIWDTATAANQHSSVAGYRLVLYKNGNMVQGIYCEGNRLALDTNSTFTAALRDLSECATCELTLNPNDFDFKPKDTVQLGVSAYAKNSLGEINWNGGMQRYGLISAEATLTSAEEVKNAGIVHVKIPEVVEGQVWVRANDRWHEAETVNVMTPSGWEESQ